MTQLFGRVLKSDTPTPKLPKELSGEVVATASCGTGWNTALRDNAVFQWGDTPPPAPAVPGGVTAVACGARFAAALSTAGEVVVWGDQGYPEMLRASMPDEVRDQKASTIAAGPDCLLAIVDGTAHWWGDWEGRGKALVVYRPSGGENAVAIAAGGHHALVLTSKGRLVFWAKNPQDAFVAPPPELLGAKVRAVSASGRLSMALTEDGTAYAWGAGPATPFGKRLLFREPSCLDVAAGYYAFLLYEQDGGRRVVAADVKGGGGDSVERTFPKAADRKPSNGFGDASPYLLRDVGFTGPVARIFSGGASPDVLALVPTPYLTVQEGYAFPAKVRPGGELAFQWRIDNAGLVASADPVVRIRLPAKVKPHPRMAKVKGLTDAGGGAYEWRPGKLAPRTDGWTVPFMTVVDQDAAGDLTATAAVSADDNDPAAPGAPLAVHATASGDGQKWEPSKDKDDDNDWWKWLLGLFGFLALLALPGGGSSSGNDNSRRNKDDEDLTTLGLDARTDAAGPSKAGGEVVLTWTVKNTGEKDTDFPSAVTVTVPTGLTVTGTDPDSGTEAENLGGGTVLFEPGTLKPGKDAKVRITAEVADDPPGTVTVEGVAEALNVVTPATRTLEVATKPVVKLDLPDGKAEPAAVAAGKEVTYTWKLTNKGPSTAKKPTLTVTLPKGLAQNKVTVQAGETKLTPREQGQNQLVADLPDLKKDAATSLTVKGAPDQAAPADLTVHLEVTASDADKVTAKAGATLKATLELLGKVLGTAVAGADVSYLWTVHNTGSADATDVRLTMTGHDARTTYDKAVPAPTGPAGPTLTWKLGTVKGGTSTDVTVRYLVGADQGGARLASRQALVTGANADGTGPKTDPTPTVEAGAVLRLTGSDVTAPVDIGSTATFTWDLENTSHADAQDITVKVTPSGYLTGSTVDSPAGGKAGSGAVGFATVKAGQKLPQAVRLTGVLDPPHAGLFLTYAEAVQGARNLAGDASSVVAVSRAKLTAAATAANPSSVDAGAELKPGWTLTPDGAGPLDDATVTIRVPDRVRLDSVTVDGHVVKERTAPEGGTAHVFPLDPAPAKPVTVEAVCRPDDDLPAGTALAISATPGWKGAPANVPAATVAVTTTHRAVLTVAPRTPFAKPDPVVPGQAATMSWTVTNNGPSACGAASLTAVPAPSTGLVLHSALVDGRPAAVEPATWAVGTGPLHAAGKAEISLTFSAAPDTPRGTPTVKGTATAGDKTVQDGSAQAGLTVTPKASLTAEPMNAPESAVAGSHIAYSWNLENQGPSTTGATFAVIVTAEKTKVSVDDDTIPEAGLTRTSAATTVTWKTTILPGYPQQVFLTATTDDVAGQLTLTTRLTADGGAARKDTLTTRITAR
ncbi:hypothetical protein GCM10009639_34230 [Kitasatospora putterlickiae]|uniref:DUF11 domain-containing protein n=1 Tax=Kitasatospora putterlickiae TaxID=221725 RepID=A0ABP4IW56_9ACTN